jgi:hypothetical protein
MHGKGRKISILMDLGHVIHLPPESSDECRKETLHNEIMTPAEVAFTSGDSALILTCQPESR